MRLAVLGVAAAGDAFVKTTEGRTLFVPGAVVGDEYEVTLASDGGLAKAERVADSAYRRPSFCAVARCGGCAWREHELFHAAEQKRLLVREALERRSAPLPSSSDLVADGQLHYRHRVRLHAARGAIGYLRAESHQIEPFTGCEVTRSGLTAAINKLAKKVPRELAGELDLVHGDDDHVGLCVTLEKKADSSVAVDWARDAVTSGVVCGAQVFDHKGELVRAFGDPIVVMRHPSGAAFALQAGVFSQANWAQNAQLVVRVAAAVADAQQVLELHAGAGNLTLGYAAQAGSVLCTEVDERAMMLARRNLAKHTHVQLRALRDDAALALAGSSDVLVLDPPRTGAEKVCRAVAAGQGAFQRIVYVSCDPRSLARDLQLLTPRYVLREITVLDLFAGTPHVETLAVLLLR